MNKRLNIYLLNLIVFLQGLVFYAPVATIYRENRGISLSEIFIIESIYMVFIILLEIPWGIFADKFGYKKTLLLSNFIFLVSKVIFFKANSFTLFFIERLLLAFSISGLSGCDSAMMYLSLNENENSEKIFATYGFFSNLGFLTGSVVATFIIDISIDLAAFYTIIPYALAFLLSFLLKEIGLEENKKVGVKGNIKSILKKRSMLIFIISMALITEVFQSITVFLNQGIYMKSKIDIKYFGIILSIIQIIRLISVKSYKITNKFGQKKIIIFLVISILISSVVLIFTSNPLLAISGIAIITTSMSFVEPISMDIKNKSILSSNRATILSIYSMIGSLVSASINPIIGLASNFSIECGLFTCTIICLISIILLRIYK
ncbi:MFS transporter [uncultured Clostridium sp.]|uniref:MFS transporter n=1 Tax=uncultured Clostridium sp. TaxID=59620 RepID=UPI002589C3CD|nr:MFS transporter [uncultured Clostridium sp.]